MGESTLVRVNDKQYIFELQDHRSVASIWKIVWKSSWATWMNHQYPPTNHFKNQRWRNQNCNNASKSLNGLDRMDWIPIRASFSSLSGKKYKYKLSHLNKSPTVLTKTSLPVYILKVRMDWIQNVIFFNKFQLQIKLLWTARPIDKPFENKASLRAT